MTTLCPKCFNGSGVTDSRSAEATIRRRRKCKVCEYRWTTYELAAPEFEETHAPLRLFNDLLELDKPNRTLIREVVRGLLATQAMKLRRVA